MTSDLAVLVCCRYMLPWREDFAAVFRRRGITVLVPDSGALKRGPERMTEDDLLAFAGRVDGIVCADDALTARVLQAAAPRLKVVAKWGTGLDAIDREAAERLGIKVRNVPGAFTVPVAESALAYMLAFARGQPWQDREVKGGVWRKPPGRTLAESALGVIGVGDIGQQVLRLARAFGMTLLGHDVRPIDPDFLAETGVEPVGLEELLARADFVSLNCDLNPTSRGLISRERLALLKPGAVLVNTARGAVVDEAALAEALAAGRLGGAGLDVFVDEPLPEASPLRRLDNVLLAPHNSNSSPRYWERVHRRTLCNLLEILQPPVNDPELQPAGE